MSQAGKLAYSREITVSPDATVQFLGSVPQDHSELLVNLQGYHLRYDHPELINVANSGSIVVRYPELRTDHGFDIRFWPDKHGGAAFGTTQEDGVLT